MALLAFIRAPQPKAPYRNPGMVSNTGSFVGWSIPQNPGGFVSVIYYSHFFGTGAFSGSPTVPTVPISTTAVLPARWGLLRGGLPYQVVAGP